MAQLTRDDLIDVLRRTTDPGWLDPLLADLDSAAILYAFADQLAFLSNVGQIACDNGLISLASGGRGGTALLTLTRATTGIGGTIPKGYQFADARGILAVNQSDYVVDPAATTITLAVTTLRFTELVNTVLDPLFTVSLVNKAALDTGGTNALISPAGPPDGLPPIVATTFTTVASSSAIEGGASDWLTAHGSERGQLRQANEDEGHYRLRIRNVPDAITPIAISQAVQGAASHAGLPPFNVEEPFEDGATPALKEANYLSSFDGTFTDTDYLADPDRELNDYRTARAYFRLEPTDALLNPDGLGLFADDGFYDDPVFGFSDTGLHPKLLSSLMSVWEEANRKRAAGVQFDIYVDAPLQVVKVDLTTSNTPHLIWAAEPASSSKVWIYVDGVFSHDFAYSPQPATGTVPGAFHRIVFTFEDATTWTAPDWAINTEQHLSLQALLAMGMPFKRITIVEGFAETDGTHPINLVGELYVVEAAV
jgi:hypothetical protein